MVTILFMFEYFNPVNVRVSNMYIFSNDNEAQNNLYVQ